MRWMGFEGAWFLWFRDFWTLVGGGGDFFAILGKEGGFLMVRGFGFLGK